MKKFLISMLACAVLLLSGNPVSAADSAPQGSFTYPIRQGTNLTRIAKDFKVSKQALIEANKNNKSLKSPDLILSGGQLKIPNVYSRADVEIIKNESARKKAEALQAAENGFNEKYARRGMANAILALLSIVLFILAFKYYFNCLDERSLKDSLKKRLATAEADLKTLRNSDSAKSEMINKLEINLQVNQEQINALQQAKKEAENRRSDLLEAYKKIEMLESEIKNRPVKGDKIILKSQENGELEFTVNKVDVFVNCPAEHCMMNLTQTLKLKNALGHFFNGHSNSHSEVRPSAEPKNENSQTEGFPAQAADEPK